MIVYCMFLETDKNSKTMQPFPWASEEEGREKHLGGSDVRLFDCIKL